MKTPVLFLIFNRPETTFRVFEAIRHYQPEELFIAADGPRPHKAEDAARCEKVRSILCSEQRIWDANMRSPEP